LVTDLVDAAGALGYFDLFVLSSRFEGAPYAPLEAMAAGVPVVLTDVVGSRDILCRLPGSPKVPAGQPDALAKAIIDLGSSTVRRRELADAGRKLVEKTFDLSVTRQMTFDLYRFLLGFN
jgi:glycosyltransferase involved in cell wall biosynthesis